MNTIESLLNLKRWSEDEAKHHFALRLKELASEERRLHDSEEQYGETSRKFEDASGELIDIAEIKKLNGYLEHLLVKIRQQKEVIIKKELQVEEARAILQEASKEKKIFEKLDEHQKNVLIRESKRKEQKGTDEHAVIRHTIKDRQ